MKFEILSKKLSCLLGTAILSGVSITTTFAQNNCSDAVMITSIPFSSGIQTTCGTVNDYEAGSYGASTLYGEGEDYVYQIEITTAPVTYEFTLGGSASYKILDVNASCPPTSFTSIGGVTTSFGTSGSTSITFPSNGTYYIYIDTWPSPDCGEFSLNITLPPSPPINDECANAIDLSSGTYLANESTIAASQEMAPIVCEGYLSDNAHDVWYKVTADEDGELTVTATTVSGDIVLFAYSGTCGSLSLISCSDMAISSGDEEITLYATEGETYYFRVYRFSSTSGAIFDIVASGDPLSIEMSKITANNIGKSNQINWNSYKEATGDKYIIERSRDGNTYFSIAEINAKGQASSYEYVDNTPFVGANYYRIKTVNVDGSFSFTNTAVAHMNALGNTMTVYPNPSNGIFTIEIPSMPSNQSRIYISDITGREVKMMSAFVSNTIQVDISDVPNGIYFIKYIDENHSEVIKVTKE